MSAQIPPYKQIAAHIENAILSGKLLPGTQLSPIRTLSAQHHVNPNTAERAIRDLKSRRFVETRLGKGSFVTADVNFISRCRQERSHQIVAAFIEELYLLGYSKEEMIALCVQSIGE